MITHMIRCLGVAALLAVPGLIVSGQQPAGGLTVPTPPPTVTQPPSYPIPSDSATRTSEQVALSIISQLRTGKPFTKADIEHWRKVLAHAKTQVPKGRK
jgi:hypothetical protein